jgi:hypothetical protein
MTSARSGTATTYGAPNVIGIHRIKGIRRYGLDVERIELTVNGVPDRIALKPE